MEKLWEIEHKKHFGAHLEAYDNGKWYLLIITDRDGRSYFIVDKNIENMYPINSVIRKLDIHEEFSFYKLDSINLSNLGKVPCPKYVVDYFAQTVKK